jgi:hypothetical protein
MAIVFAAALAIALAASALAGLIAGESAQAILGTLAPIWAALRFVFYAVLAIVSYLSAPFIVLATAIFSVIGRLLRGPIGSAADFLRSRIELFSPAEQLEELPQGDPFDRLPREPLTAIFLIGLILLVTLALGRVVQLRRRAMAEGGVREPSPYLNMQPRLSSLADRVRSFLNIGGRRRAAETIRHIYRRLCAVAAAYGYPRPPNQTPNEFLATLAQVWPNLLPESRVITEAYNRVRYGELPESKAEMDAIKAAWLAIQRAPPPGAPPPEGPSGASFEPYRRD